MLHKSKFDSLFSFLFFLAIISYFIACNNTNENMFIAPSQTFTDNGGDNDCTGQYSGICSTIHRCLKFDTTAQCETPVNWNRDVITVEGTTCDNEYYYCSYGKGELDETVGFGEVFPDGTYEIIATFYNDTFGHCWTATKTLTFNGSNYYNQWFCMIFIGQNKENQ